jgi:hypothetical protein
MGSPWPIGLARAMLVAVRLACVHFRAVSVEGHRAVLVDLDGCRSVLPAIWRMAEWPRSSGCCLDWVAEQYGMLRRCHRGLPGQLVGLAGCRPPLPACEIQRPCSSRRAASMLRRRSRRAGPFACCCRPTLLATSARSRDRTTRRAALMPLGPATASSRRTSLTRVLIANRGRVWHRARGCGRIP